MMRFRYLIAAPFVSHGSRIRNFIESEVGDVRCTRVLPYEPISMWDFALLRHAFEQAPLLIGHDPMRIYFDRGWVCYEGCPDIVEFERLIHSEAMYAWFTLRETSRRDIYAELAELAGALSLKSKDQVSTSVVRFYSRVAPLLSPLIVSIFVDELLFERYRVIDTLMPIHLRDKIQFLVFSSPFTVAWASENLDLTRQKRIVDTWDAGSYVAQMCQSPLDSLGDARANFMDSMTNLGLDDMISNHLWTIHVMVQFSEELHYLWGSLATLLSSAITLAGAPCAPFYATQPNE